MNYLFFGISGILFVVSFAADNSDITRDLVKISALWAIAGALV